MQVITYSPSLLQAAADCLSSQILRNGDRPQYIIAIRQGGAEVGKLMKTHFPEAEYEEITLTRSFGIQKSVVSPILRRLPVWFKDGLRMLEIRLMDLTKRTRVPERFGEVTLLIAPKAGETLLLIDDAIDTGATIQKAAEEILRAFPGIKIKVAVITVTTDHPLYEADYCLYHNRTLCRFPWSMDY